MRYVTARFRLDGGALHPWGATLTNAPEVTRGPMYRMELLEDDTANVLCRLFGDLDRGLELTREHPYVIETTVTDADVGFLYVRLHLTTVSKRMLSFPRRTELALSMPLTFEDDGAAVATFVGGDAELTGALDEIPDAVDVELIETGEYIPETNDIYESFTERQRTILDIAVRMGYYECPREATQSDIAAELDLSPGTVGEHLRKIEAQTFQQMLE